MNVTRGAVLALWASIGCLAWPGQANATWSLDLSSGSDTYYIGCVTRAGLTSRIWGCNPKTGVWTQINVDCVMDEDIIVFGNAGNDTIVVGHGTDNTIFTSTYTCGGETRNFGDITHSWGGNNWDIIIEGEEDNDVLYGDQSRYTYAIAGSGYDELRQFGSGGLEGDGNGDTLLSQNWSYDLERMYGDLGADCLEDASDDHTSEPEATVFDCGTTAGNEYVDCCLGSSPGQPDAACSILVDSCLGGPELAQGAGGGVEVALEGE